MKQKNEKEILCTLGPASLNDRVIHRLTDLGVSLFRINLSHTKLEDVPRVIEFIQKRTKVPVCLDTEGAQIRTGSFSRGKMTLEEHATVRIVRAPVLGNGKRFNLYPNDIIDRLIVGDLVSIDFNSVLVQVTAKKSGFLTARVVTGGLLGQNKAVSVQREIDLPALTEKDLAAIKIGKKMGIHHVALSFANSAKDVEALRALVEKNTFVISKIESLSGIRHLEDIARKSDAVLIDRGDLSRQLAIEQIPRAQKEIIKRAKATGVKVYVATNLLESMIHTPTPTRAEVNDIFNTLNDGADGLVLAAETAIGSYPVGCAMMVSKVISHYIDYTKNSSSLPELERRDSLLLVEPHGGKLVHRTVGPVSSKTIQTYKRLSVDITTLLDAEQIAIGVFSPLEGFMNQKDLESVLSNYRLSNGVVWPMPIVLQAAKEQALQLKTGETVALTFAGSNEIYALLSVEDIYEVDLKKFCRGMFQTNDEHHPGVQVIKKRGNYFIGGKIELIKRLPSDHKHYEITPQEARTIFENKGWSRVVGFHTRNVVHRAHEYLQLASFEKNFCDGIFIHPLIGPKKRGDYSARVILSSYEMAIKKFYPKGKVLLAAFSSYSRYAGPREAVFTALCRKNFGCSHFIVGRDHTGLGAYYGPDEAHRLFDELGDIGIKPIFFNEVHYCRKCGDYVEKCKHSKKDILKISGTEGREMIQKRKMPPGWFMRGDVAKYLLREIKKGREVFIT